MTTAIANDRIGKHLGSAIRFWEAARIPFNGAMLLVVLAVLGIDRFFALSNQDFMALGVLAVIANILYCAAYIPDVVVQMSDMEKGFLTISRVAIWFVGASFAMMLTYFSFVDGVLIFN